MYFDDRMSAQDSPGTCGCGAEAAVNGGTEVISEHAELVAIAGAAAAALVGEMLKDGWSAMRDATIRLFRHAGEAEQQRQTTRLDADREQLDSLDEAALRDRWQRRFITLVEDFPEALKDLAAIASQNQSDQSGTTNQNATGNTGPVVQIGRDNFGGLNIGRQRGDG
ncbi:hypothetical protein HCN51_56150 [Nonomuraea sp. FMUSA5-5]|uniref:Uncharacterized protein n=1 Tax=Nonomuraea composti TaxID=2720023 RepID=A0ABX1BNN7_9ACTN|nr:hypothetical protein [Nonomuraea sp. FMUSA5-5]NJP98657.1 hypothetical protein [Nonomuraea sp. FMUSA5-5]